MEEVMEIAFGPEFLGQGRTEEKTPNKNAPGSLGIVPIGFLKTMRWKMYNIRFTISAIFRCTVEWR